jgi:putative oxidoreductase
MPMQFAWLSRWQRQILGVLRIVTALLLIEHGTMKLFHFPAAMMPGPLPPLLLAAAIIEVVAGLLVTVGLFARLAAFILSGENAVAYFMVHFPKTFWPTLNQGEVAILFCFVFLYIAAAGPGAWSIDSVRARKAPIR